MDEVEIQDDDIPAEIDFSQGVRGLHHIPPDAKIIVPASIERQASDDVTEAAPKRRTHTKISSSSESRIVDRHALFRAYNGVCCYCGRSLDWLDFEVEHIISRDRGKHPAEWHAVLKDHGLPEDFDVDCDENLAVACGPCNRTKSKDLLPNLGVLLLKAKRTAPKVRHFREKFFTERQQQKLKADLAKALEQDGSFRDDFYTTLSIGVPTAPPAHPKPWLNDAAYWRAKDLLGNASRSLLREPQTIDGQWLDRVELHDLSQAHTSEKCHLLPY
jgi:5-methylcytosine-specific restriction endonuclease McrA